MAKLRIVVLRLLFVFVLQDTEVKADIFMQFFRQGNGRPTEPKHIVETNRHLFGHQLQSVNIMDPYLKVLLKGKKEESMKAPRQTVTSTPKIPRVQSQNSDVLKRMMLLGVTNEQSELRKPVYKNDFGVPATNNRKTTLQGNFVGQPQWVGFSAKRDQSWKINNSFSNTAKTYDAILHAVLDQTTTPKPRSRVFMDMFTTRKPRPVGFVGPNRFRVSLSHTSSFTDDRMTTRSPRFGVNYKKNITRAAPVQVIVNKHESFGSAVNYFTKKVPKPTTGMKKTTATGKSTQILSYQQASTTTSIRADSTTDATSSSSHPVSTSVVELTTVLSTTPTHTESSTSATNATISTSSSLTLTATTSFDDTTTPGLDSLQDTTPSSSEPEFYANVTEASQVITVTVTNNTTDIANATGINNLTEITNATGTRNLMDVTNGINTLTDATGTKHLTDIANSTDINNMTDFTYANGINDITIIANATEAMKRTSTMTPYHKSSEQNITLSYIETVSETSSIANETAHTTSSTSSVSYATEYVTIYTANMTESSDDSKMMTTLPGDNSSTAVTVTSYTTNNIETDSSDITTATLLNFTVSKSTTEILNDTSKESTSKETTTSRPEESTTSGLQNEATSSNKTTDETTTTTSSSFETSPLVTSPGSTTCDPSSCSDFEDICMNGGTCVSKCTGLMCECPPGYHGFTCDKRDAAITASTQISD